MKISKLIWTIIALLLVLVIAGGIYDYFTRSGNAQVYSSQNTVFSALTKSNPYFAQAQAAANAGNYQEAKTLYEEALGQAQDSTQQGQIAFKLALLEDYYGDPIKAVDMYEAIVANPEYANYPIIKAYAVESMAELYFRTGNTAVTAEIFKDAPYSSFVVPGNISLTYLHFEEYAASFYPLGLVEVRIADWYAGNSNATSTPDGVPTSSYPAIMQHAITLANADIARTQSDPNAATLIPDILVGEEALYLRMYTDNLATAQQTEQACEAAMNIFVSDGLQYQDGFARYYYALFLSTQGPSREADLETTLAPLSTDYAGYKGAYIMSFLASGSTNTLGQKKNLVTLANEDPQFKTLLLSLGWTAKDF